MKIIKELSLILLIAWLLSCSPAQSDPSYELAGRINGLDSGTVILEYDGHKIRAKIDNGRFLFSGVLQKPSLCRIHIEGSSDFKKFYLENSSMSFTAEANSLDSATISGSKTEIEQISYKE